MDCAPAPLNFHYTSLPLPIKSSVLDWFTLSRSLGNDRCALSFLNVVCESVPRGPQLVEERGGLEALDDLHYSGQVPELKHICRTPPRHLQRMSAGESHLPIVTLK